MHRFQLYSSVNSDICILLCFQTCQIQNTSITQNRPLFSQLLPLNQATTDLMSVTRMYFLYQLPDTLLIFCKKIILFTYLFIFGCVGSSLLLADSLQLWRVGATLPCGVQVFSLRWLLLLSTGSRHMSFSSCSM